MAHKWAEKLQEEKVQEFSFYPHAYTPLEEESGFTLPEVEMEYGGDDQKDSGSPQDQAPSWVKNLSFSVGGVTLGAAAVYGLFAAAPPPPLPFCSPAAVQTCPTPAKPATLPSSTGRPATLAPAAPAATLGTPTSTPAGSAGTTSAGTL